VRRFKELGIDLPEMLVVDNCCHVRNAVLRAIPTICVLLDVYHFLMRPPPVSLLVVIASSPNSPLAVRYLGTIKNGTKNPYRAQVANDISSSILKKKANGKGGRAEYWSKEEQTKRLTDVYQKWSKTGNVWSAASAKVSKSVEREHSDVE